MTDGAVDVPTLRGERVVLRPADRSGDAVALAAMLAEPEVARWWGEWDLARVESELLVAEPGFWLFVIDVGGEVAGVVQSYEEPDPQYRSASVDISLSARWRGTGVAVDALRTLARELIEQRCHHHLTIDPAAANARAIACYAKVGFKPVGILRQNEQGLDGTFHDTLLMDLVADELA
jgi:aminoglycoside 6'-N-acetyltransferase